MSKPLIHAQSSARRYGGQPADYLAIHNMLDRSKEAHADVRHRALFHHSLGPFIMEEIFGVALVNSEGREVAVRDIAEQHIIEDMGFIPNFSDYCNAMSVEDWMAGARKARFRVLD